MSRIAGAFERLRTEHRTALITYVAAGDPNPTATVPLMHQLVAGGADIIEVGVPFSDPIADGPVIQAACERALRHGIGLQAIFDQIAEFRATDPTTPVVLMGYLNPIEAMGYEPFIEGARRAGVDGVLTVDLPPEEGEGLDGHLLAAGIDPVFLVAPTTTAARLAAIARVARGFVYYVSVKGVTGSGQLDVAAIGDQVAALRAATAVPVGVGFGIKDGATAAAVAELADAVVVGSALVERIGAHGDDVTAAGEAIRALTRELRVALDQPQTQRGPVPV
jgi:tryptophan synthase alpha chain